MGRRAKLPDHGPKVHDFRECVSKAEADAMWRKYSFRRVGFDFHGELNEVLSWHDIFLDFEERPANESIKILHAVYNAATLLRAHLGKPGADRLLCVYREISAPDPFMRVRHPTADTRVLVALEARCSRWPEPAKRLRQDIRNASERLRDALAKAGDREIPTLFDYGRFPSPANISSALDWWIQASAKAVKQIEGGTHRPQPDEMPKGKRKPTRSAPRLLIRMLWKLFQSANPKKGDTIRWDRTNKQYAGTFYEFVREIFPKVEIRLSGARLGDLVKRVGADK